MEKNPVITSEIRKKIEEAEKKWKNMQISEDDMAAVSGGRYAPEDRPLSWTPCPVCHSEDVVEVEFSDVVGSIYYCNTCYRWFIANGRAACSLDDNWVYYDQETGKFIS
ncbi:MAG: hypothetical protein IKD68_08000 [Solobacterium sp.]|nr:hypothetical protein [Solobacterium sp.]